MTPESVQNEINNINGMKPSARHAAYATFSVTVFDFVKGNMTAENWGTMADIANIMTTVDLPA